MMVNIEWIHLSKFNQNNNKDGAIAINNKISQIRILWKILDIHFR